MSNFATVASTATGGLPSMRSKNSRIAASRIRMLADRRSGEAHPLDVGAAAVARYFKIEDECAQAVRLKLLAQQHDATQPRK
jgi:hypothetical protein